MPESITPPSYAELVKAGQAAAKAAGVPFRVHPGAEGRCRCCAGAHAPSGPQVRPYRDFVGVVPHITAGVSNDTARYIDNVIIAAGTDVPFKSQFVIASNPDSAIVLVGAGRANHCGKIGSGALAKLRRGGYRPDDDPYDDSGRGAQVDGNTHTVGIEVMARSKMTDRQRTALCALTAALLRLRGLDAGHVAGHGEIATSRTSADPGEHMGRLRRDIRDFPLDFIGPAPAPTPTPNQEDIMAGEAKALEALIKQLSAQLAKTDARLTEVIRSAAQADVARDERDAARDADIRGALTGVSKQIEQVRVAVTAQGAK